MADDKKFELSRRKVLGSIGTIGAASAAAGAGTMAVFNDEENSTGNTVTAGKLDLKLDWTKSYNGSVEDSYEDVVQPLTDNPGPVFELDDVKPGDSGVAAISIHSMHNPAWVHAGGELTMNFENSINEPEGEVDSSSGQGNGELADAIMARVWQEEDGDGSFDDNSNSGFPADRMLIGEDTLANVLSILNSGVLLDGDLSTEEADCFPVDQDRYLGFEWWVPLDVGNEIQSDRIQFDLKFHAQQCRHVDDPENPYSS